MHFTLNPIIPPLTNSLIYNLVLSFPTLTILVPHSDPSTCFPPESGDIGDMEAGEEGGERKRRYRDTMEIDEIEEKELLNGGNLTTLQI